MTPSRALAAAQTVPIPCDVAANLEQHVELAEVASAEGARTVLFPELSLTGYELDRAPKLAFSREDPRLRTLLETADATSTTLIVGAPLVTGDRLHIGAFVLSPDRSVRIYTKRHLGAFSSDANSGGPVPPAEPTVFAPGDTDPLVEIAEGVSGVGICSDVNEADYVEQVARRGAQTYFASMFVIPSALAEDRERLRRYAELHSIPVVFSNFGGPSGGLPSGGCSAIWSETGDLVTHLDGTGRGVAVALHDPDGWKGSAMMFGD